MNREQIEEAVRRRLDAESINPATGTAPDARLNVTALPVHVFGATAGNTDPGAPDSWSVTATLFFPRDDAEHQGSKIARILERFETAIGAEDDFGGGARLTWRGTDRGPHGRLDAPAGYDTAVDVLLTVVP